MRSFFWKWIFVSTFYFTNTSLLSAAQMVNVSVEPLALIVREICAEQCDVVTLVPKGASEHAWHPSPKDVVRAKDAVASVSIGLGFDEAWFKKLGVTPKSVLKLGAQLSPMSWWSDDMIESIDHKHDGKKSKHHGHDAEHKDSHHHDSLSNDPHVWTDAGRMSMAADLVAKHLSLYIPGAAASFKDRASKLAERLTKLQLDTDARRRAWRTRPVVMFHDVAGYFARRFNLPVLTVSAGSSGHNLSAKMIANVTKRFKDVSVAAVMVEKSDGAAKSLAKELKTQVKVVDFGAIQSYQRWDDWYLHLVSSWESVLK